MSDERIMDDLARKKAKATGGLHTAMTVWSVGAAAALGFWGHGKGSWTMLRFGER